MVQAVSSTVSASMSPLPLPTTSTANLKSYFLSAAIETLMFGIFLALFPQAIYVILRYPKAVSIRSISCFNKTVLVVCSILFCSITAHWILSNIVLYIAFFHTGSPTQETVNLVLALEFLANLASPLNCARTILSYSQILCQDFVLIYRMFIVWGRNTQVIVLPALSFTLTTGLMLPLAIKLSSTNRPTTDSVTPALITATYLSTMFTTIYSSLMIGWKIWKSNRSLKEINQDSVKPLPFLLIILESAGLYSLAIIVGFISYLFNSLVELTALDITGSFIGTSLCLMVLRVKIIRGRHQFSEESAHSLHFRPNVSGNIEMSRAPSLNVVKVPSITEIDADEEKEGERG